MSVTINRFFLILVVMILCSCNKRHGIDSFYGTWSVTKYKFGQSTVAFDDEKQAARYINKKIILSQGNAEVFEDKCSKPTYEVNRINTKDLFYQEFKESDSTILPSTDSVEINIVSCSSRPEYKNTDSLNFVYYLILLNEKEMLTSVDGVYLYLRKE